MHYAPENFQAAVRVALGMARAIHGRIEAVGEQVRYHDLGVEKSRDDAPGRLPDVDQAEIDFVYQFIDAMTALEPDTDA